MPRNQRIMDAIFAAVAELNQQLPADRQLVESDETGLFGHNGKLDSFGLVNLIVAIEENISDEFSVPITIADERAMSQKSSPFKTIGTLADYVAVLLKEAAIDVG